MGDRQLTSGEFDGDNDRSREGGRGGARGEAVVKVCGAWKE